MSECSVCGREVSEGVRTDYVTPTRLSALSTSSESSPEPDSDLLNMIVYTHSPPLNLPNPPLIQGSRHLSMWYAYQVDEHFVYVKALMLTSFYSRF